VAFVVVEFVFDHGVAFAQGGAPTVQAPTTKGAVIKGKAPVNKNVLQVKLPRAEEASLPNGLRIVLLRSTKVPTFTMQMVVLSGGLSDKADYRGVASSTAALLREGTTTRSSKDIAEQVDAAGATLFATSGLSSMTSSVTASARWRSRIACSSVSNRRRISSARRAPSFLASARPAWIDVSIWAASATTASARARAPPIRSLLVFNACCMGVNKSTRISCQKTTKPTSWMTNVMSGGILITESLSRV